MIVQNQNIQTWLMLFRKKPQMNVCFEKEADQLCELFWKFIRTSDKLSNLRSVFQMLLILLCMLMKLVKGASAAYFADKKKYLKAKFKRKRLCKSKILHNKFKFIHKKY